MKIKYLMVMFGIVSFAGCATAPHSTMRGSVAMKVNDEEAHICMGDNEVKAGDRLAVFKNVCTAVRGGGKAGGGGVCEKRKMGEGTIERTLNEHYSVVKFDTGVPFDEGTIVEKE